MNLFFTGACNFYDAGLHTGWIYRCLCLGLNSLLKTDMWKVYWQRYGLWWRLTWQLSSCLLRCQLLRLLSIQELHAHFCYWEYSSPSHTIHPLSGVNAKILSALWIFGTFAIPPKKGQIRCDDSVDAMKNKARNKCHKLVKGTHYKCKIVHWDERCCYVNDQNTREKVCELQTYTILFGRTVFAGNCLVS